MVQEACLKALSLSHHTNSQCTVTVYNCGFFLLHITKSPVHGRVCVPLRPGALPHLLSAIESLIVSPQWCVISDSAI